MKRLALMAPLAATCLVLISACSMDPAYTRPTVALPSDWPDSGASSSSALAMTEQSGWEAFVLDDNLRSVVEQAIANNRDLRIAMLNVESARAQYRIERSGRVPSLSATADGTRQRLAPANAPTGVSGVTEVFQSSIAATAFELDLFGRLRSLSTAALNEYFATEEVARSARITLTAEVIQAYIRREGLHRQLIRTQEIVESRIEARERIVLRRQAGMANALEQEEAETLANQARADRERLDRQYRQASNALATLIGVRDGSVELPAPADTETPLVAEIAAGTPSEILVQRPDVRAAERRLQARNADIGAARAAFFPRVSLTGAFGSASTDFSSLYSSGTRTWSFSPQISLPIFTGGRNTATLDVAEVRKDIAVADYEKSIQIAFGEVADALAAKDTLRNEGDALSAVIRNSQTAARLSEARYRAGLDSYLRYLDAQRVLYAAEIAAIEVDTQRQIALTQMFKAMGGTWLATPPPTAASSGS